MDRQNKAFNYPSGLFSSLYRLERHLSFSFSSYKSLRIAEHHKNSVRESTKLSLGVYFDKDKFVLTYYRKDFILT